MDVFSTALSGLNAATSRIANSANNIANARTPDFKATEAVQRSLNDGGVIVDIRERQPSQVETADGKMPNVSLEQEVVNSVVAQNDYLANIRVLKVQKELDKSLLDIQA